MEKEHFNKKILSTVLAVLLLSSMIAMLAFATTGTVSATNSINTTGYGDPNQEAYAYPVGPGADSANTFYNAGPAPDTPTIKYQITAASLGLTGTLNGAPPIAFNNMVFAYTSSPSRLVAIDAQTGALKWAVSIPATPRGFGTATFFKVDDTHIGWEGSSGVYIASTIDGTITGSLTLNLATDGFTGFGGGSVMYWGGFYSSYDSMKYSTAAAQAGYYTDPATGQVIKTVVHIATAVDCSDPTNPHIAWTWVAPTGIESLGSAPGMAIFGGYGEGQIYVLDANTGKLLWQDWKTGNCGYATNYYEGVIYQSASSTRITAWNATTGEKIFDHDEGARAFFVFGDALAYGMYIGKNIALPNSFVGAWDATTGESLWKTPALYNIAYLTGIVADGKFYIQRYSGTAGGVGSQGYSFACFDAFTGDVIWEMPGYTFNEPMIAYGNLYAIASGTLYCIGDTTSNFTQFHPNGAAASNPGAINGQTGPSDISTPYWVSDNYGSITGSAVAANGVVYFGSLDKNIYALNANTGAKIWNFTTGYRVSSTPAVVGNVVYTGADDGNVYALNAATGQQVWKTSVGGLTKVFWIPAWQGKSSPQVDNGQVFVGSLDGKLYCLSATDGHVIWASNAGNETFPIGGTPLVTPTVVYIASGDAYLYAFNRADGTQLWKCFTMGSQTGFQIRAFLSTPILDPRGGSLWVAANTGFIDRINTTTGVIMNEIRLPFSADSGTMTPAITAPAIYQNGTQYYLYVGDGMEEVAFNVTSFKYGSNLVMNSSYSGGFMSKLNPTVYYNDATLGKIVAINATTANNVDATKYVANETWAPVIWTRWLGHQIYSSTVLLNDMQGMKIYLGNDVFSITAVDAVTGNTISEFTTGGPVFSTACIYNGTLFMGAEDGYMYAFKDAEPTNAFTLQAFADKSGVMWNNETLTIQGVLRPAEKFYTDPDGNQINLGSYAANRLPNATVTVTIVLPDMSSVDIPATTDNLGYFTVQYQPTAVGNYSWIAIYGGEQKGYITYEEAYTGYSSIESVAAPGSDNPTPTTSPDQTVAPTDNPTTMPTETVAPTSTTTDNNGFPVEYIYAIVAVIVIVVIAVAAFMVTKRKK